MKNVCDDSFKLIEHVKMAHTRACAHQNHQKVKSQRNVNCMNDKLHYQRFDVCVFSKLKKTTSIYIHFSIKCKGSTKQSKRASERATVKTESIQISLWENQTTIVIVVAIFMLIFQQILEYTR